MGDALLEALGAKQAIYCPAFPENGRTIFFGHLFVGDVLLSDTHMRADENPGRAGSVRTSGDGPSAIAFDFSFSSMTTILRAVCIFAINIPISL